MGIRRNVWPLALVLVASGTLEANADGLAGTSWRLVEIVFMNDQVDVPDDPAKYTLDLKTDGSALMRADCNTGTGTWTSESAGQIQFGPLASTHALCPPGSSSEKYLAQFEWVRSYVVKDDHLFLATMADGSIIEFEPARDAPPVATLLGQAVHVADAGELQELIVTKLFDRYAAEHGIEAEPAEIGAFLDNMRRGMAAKGLTAQDELTPKEAAELEVMQQEMARAMIRRWKINRALYDQYGGRIIYQQLGPEPLDAYRRFLEQNQKAGAFAIHDQGLVDGFWRYFTDESLHDFMEPGGADAARAFSVPPWERQP